MNTEIAETEPSSAFYASGTEALERWPMVIDHLPRIRSHELPAETGILSSQPDLTSSCEPLTKHDLPVFLRRPKAVPNSTGRFVIHESWEGVVEEVYHTYFVAQLRSSVNVGISECAEIYRDKVSESDVPLLQPGAVFYWSIGYRDSSNGQRTRASTIRFRRLPSLARSVEDSWIGAVRQKWLKSS